MKFIDPFPPSVEKRISPLTILQYVVFGSAILYFGRQIFVPLAYATLISFVLYPLCAQMERKGIGRIGAISISVGLLTMLVALIFLILVKQITGFAGEWNDLQSKISLAFSEWKSVIIQSFGITSFQLEQWISKSFDVLMSGLVSFITSIISGSASSIAMSVLTPVYVVLILYYRKLWKEVLFRVFPKESHQNIDNMLSLTIQTYYKFIKGMGIVYVVVGLLNSVGLMFLGIPHAFLFGFIASILTFIPYVGIIVGALLPVAIAWATHDSIWYPVGVIGVFTLVQYLEANFIFPFAVSRGLNVNTLAVLVSIFTGGLLWGVSGMILFVPMVGILKLIADHDTRLQTLSMALGTGPGKVNSKEL